MITNGQELNNPNPCQNRGKISPVMAAMGFEDLQTHNFPSLSLCSHSYSIKHNSSGFKATSFYLNCFWRVGWTNSDNPISSSFNIPQPQTLTKSNGGQ